MARQKTNRVTCRMTDDKIETLENLSKQMGVSKSDVLNISLEAFNRIFNGSNEQGEDDGKTGKTKTRKTKK